MSIAALITPFLPSFLIPTSPTKFTLLFFASSWCPDCTPAVPALSSFYTSINSATANSLQCAYVSSDRNDGAIKKHASQMPEDWFTVPNADDRTGLKALFGCCAGSETSSITGIKRKHGIPTVFVLESATLKVCSEDGLGDIRKHGGDKVLGIWGARAAKIE